MLDKEFYTISELVDMGLGSRPQIYRLIKAGELSAHDVSVPGSKRSVFRISTDSIRSFIEDRSV